MQIYVFSGEKDVSATNVRGVVGVLVGLLVVMLVGFIVTGTIISNTNTSSWSSEAQAAWSSLTSNIWVAFSLLVILPIIIGAVVLLHYIGVIGG